VSVLSPYPVPIEDLQGRGLQRGRRRSLSGSLSGGLGYVLTQGTGWEINRTLPGGYPYLPPFDPQYYRRGETGLYYDTPLGAIPTDAEIGPNECYTPVQSAWIYAKEGFIAPPYIPPHGWRPVTRPYGPPTAPLGQPFPPQEGNIGPESAVADVLASQAINELSRHQRRLFFLTALSTTAIVAVASINIFRAIRQERRMAAAQ
jgi:hypothetical protein